MTQGPLKVDKRLHRRARLRSISAFVFFLSLTFVACWWWKWGSNSDRTFRIQRFRVEKIVKHDALAFCQGLLANSVEDTNVLESTGLYGKSTLRRVDVASGKVVRSVQLPRQYFGEGIVAVGGKVVQLTWRESVAFVYNASTLDKIGEFPFDTTTGEGWGATFDGSHVVVSDGSDVLHFWLPETWQEVRRVEVTIAAEYAHHFMHLRRRMGEQNPRVPLTYINELQFVPSMGILLANIWGSDFIASIDPSSGHVMSLWNCSGLLPGHLRKGSEDVLNGIALLNDGKAPRLMITGKLWSRAFIVTME